MKFPIFFRPEAASAHDASSAIGGIREHLFAVVLLLAALALIYGRCGGFDYVDYDDVDYVVRNAAVHAGLSLHGIRWAFTAFYMSNWHPLTWISHMIDVSLFGLEPGPAHLVNVAFHGVNSLLVYALALRLLRNWRASLLVAYLFLAHPLHVESVAWIAERKDLLCALFFLLSILAYLRYAARPRARRYTLVVFVFALALMSKPMAVTLPMVLLLLDFWPLGRLRGEPTLIRGRRFPAYVVLFAEKIPLFALSLASGIVTLAAQTVAIAPLHMVPVIYRLMNSVVAYGTYLRDTIVPTRLAYLYPLTQQLGFLNSILPSLLVLAVISGAVVCYRNRYPWLLFGWLWFLLTLLPVIGLVQVGSQSHADRYMYLPSIGLFLALGATVARLSRAAAKKALVFAPVLLFYSFMAWIQVGYWSGPYMLVTHALDVSGDSPQLHGALAGYYLRQGRLGDAESEARKGVAALSAGSPLTYMAYGILGGVLEARKDYAGAERAYGVALNQFPGNATLLNNLGIVFEKQGQLKEARKCFAEALKADPNLQEAKENLKRVGG